MFLISVCSYHYEHFIAAYLCFFIAAQIFFALHSFLFSNLFNMILSNNLCTWLLSFNSTIQEYPDCDSPQKKISKFLILALKDILRHVPNYLCKFTFWFSSLSTLLQLADSKMENLLVFTFAPCFSRISKFYQPLKIQHLLTLSLNAEIKFYSGWSLTFSKKRPLTIPGYQDFWFILCTYWFAICWVFIIFCLVYSSGF